MKKRSTQRIWPKIRKRRMQVKGKTYQYWVLDLGVVDGLRKFLNFKTKEEAELEAESKRIERNKIGADALRLTEGLKREATQAATILAGRASLVSAAEFYMLHHSLARGQRTVSELLKEYLASKRQAGRRYRTIQDIRHRIGRFARSSGDILVQQITTHDIEEWLTKNRYTGLTRKNYRTVLAGFFEYAVRREFLQRNPASALERPTLDEKTPAILTCGEVEKLLNAAAEHAPEMIPYFSIGIFAGLRPAEIEQLDWASVDFAAKIIRVTPETAKKRRQRLVDMSENLLEWLLPYRQPSGRVHYSRRDFDFVRRKAGISWAPDVMRHTYGSYHLAKHENAAKTSLQMGHRTLDMLFNHYRDLVCREDGEEFWSIAPCSAGMAVQLETAAVSGRSGRPRDAGRSCRPPASAPTGVLAATAGISCPPSRRS